MTISSEFVPALSWRITKAEPHGFMMWFDSDEEPAVRRITLPDSEDLDGFYEGGALDGTSEEEEGVPCEGSAPADHISSDSELPF